MTALQADRQTPDRKLGGAHLPVAANTRIFAGSLVALNATGYLVPVTNTASPSTLRVIGRAAEHVDNRTAVGPGLNGSLSCLVEYGVFQWANLAGGITLADLGATAYAQDDQTVAVDSDSGNRPGAGRIVDVDEAGVWVWHNPIFITIGVGALLAANNLNDVDTAATALANLGGLAIVADRDRVVIQRLPLDAAGVFRYVHSGPDMDIVAIRTVVDGATTTTAEDVTITAAIGATPVSTGVVTIAGASAAGTVDSAVPDADNLLTEDDVLSLTVNEGSQVAASFATVTIELAQPSA